MVTQKELDDRQPAQLEDAIAYTAGVIASPWGLDDRFDECLIRGFDICTSTLYRDGLIQRLIGFSGFKIEPYGMQRIEVLKGPGFRALRRERCRRHGQRDHQAAAQRAHV